MIQILLIFLLRLHIHQQHHHHHHHQHLSLPLFLPSFLLELRPQYRLLYSPHHPLHLPLPLLPYSAVCQTQPYLQALNVIFLCTRTRALIPSQLLWIPLGIMKEGVRTSRHSIQLLDQVNSQFFLLSCNHTDCKPRDQPNKQLNISCQTLDLRP